jgi:NitT/TauT family transport system ATP-binding protein
MQLGIDYNFGKPLLEVKDVHVAYDGVPILRGVDFTIRDIDRRGVVQGQVDALLAPSGTGKTQIFRCVAGLHKPDSGSVLIDRGAGEEEVRSGMVGVVAQDYPLFDHLTVIENLTIRAGLISSKNVVDEAMGRLEHFSLADKVHLYPDQLSGGQRQRVAIIQQMMCGNHLLLMDEPFSGLDIIMKDEVQRLILAAASADSLNSVIVTTHDIQSAISVADTILLLGRDRDAQGKVIPGAYIKHKFDLIERGLAWQPNLQELPACAALEHEIRSLFKEL